MNNLPFFILLVFSGLVVPGCKNTPAEPVSINIDSAESVKPATTVGDDVNVSTEECYRMIAKRDTYDLSFVRTGDHVVGTMVFDNYEKDSSSGNILGDFDGNILHVIYSFSSEGMNSVAHHYFKQDGDKMLAGIGDVRVSGDTAYIQNPAALKYGELIYKKIDCANKHSK